MVTHLCARATAKAMKLWMVGASRVGACRGECAPRIKNDYRAMTRDGLLRCYYFPNCLVTIVRSQDKASNFWRDEGVEPGRTKPTGCSQRLWLKVSYNHASCHTGVFSH